MLVEVWRIKDELVRDGYRFNVRVLDGGKEVIAWKARRVRINGSEVNDKLLVFVDCKAVEINDDVVEIRTLAYILLKEFEG